MFCLAEILQRGPTSSPNPSTWACCNKWQQLLHCQCWLQGKSVCPAHIKHHRVSRQVWHSRQNGKLSHHPRTQMYLRRYGHRQLCNVRLPFDTMPYRRDCLVAASAMRLHLAMRPEPCSVSLDPLAALPMPFQPAKHVFCCSQHTFAQRPHSRLVLAQCQNVQ